MRYFGYGMGYGYSPLAFIPELIVWIVIIVAVVALVKYMTHQGHYYGHGHHMMGEDHTTAIDILKERYAKGEITKKEFEEMKKDILD